MSKITSKMKRHVRHELKEEGPTIWVGKEGLTPAVMVQVENQLQKTKMVKIRILKSALATDTAKAIATRTAAQLDAALVEVRGHVFIIYRRRRKPLATDSKKPPT
ncbi:MAG: YhbY family RNA-binding protein [Candidatus Bathyarchaeota archaeon]|nr:YhbY family RNA-binding protein [Candidatus Bathyarchaeota archaeon]